MGNALHVLDHLACTSCHVKLSATAHRKVEEEHAPIHVQFVLISRLDGTRLRKALHYLDRPVELGINELARIHVHL